MSSFDVGAGVGGGWWVAVAGRTGMLLLLNMARLSDKVGLKSKWKEETE